MSFIKLFQSNRSIVLEVRREKIKKKKLNKGTTRNNLDEELLRVQLKETNCAQMSDCPTQTGPASLQ